MRTLAGSAASTLAAATLTVSGLYSGGCIILMHVSSSLFHGNAALILDELGSSAEVLSRDSPKLSVFSATNPERISIAEQQ